LNADEALARFSFWPSLSEGAKQELRVRGVAAMVAPHTTLLHKGDEVGGVFLVTQGVVRVFYIDRRGRQGTLYRVDAEQACFLSIECTMRGGPYPAWAESEAHLTQLVKVPQVLFRSLYSSEPAIRAFTYDALSSRVLQLMSVVEQSASLALEQRTAVLLLSLADDTGRVTCSQTRLAEHLGSVREVVVRTLRAFRELGLLTTGRGTIQIEDTCRLKELAGLSHPGRPPLQQHSESSHVSTKGRC